MRIVQLLPSMDVGGVERGVVELSRALQTGGAESAVISRGGRLCAEIAAAGGQHIAFNSGGKNVLTFPARAYQLRRLLQRLAPDIVHVRSRLPAWLLRFAGGPFVVVSTFHGFYQVGAYSAQMTRADAVICPSTAVRAHILQHYGICAEKLHLIHRGVDQDYFNPAHLDADYCRRLRERFNLDGHTVFVMAGRVSAIKGHALFLQALARLLDSGATLPKPPVALIVGNDEGKRTQRLRALAQTLGISHAVRFAGVMQRMREIYAISDVAVSASIRAEAFGRTVAEALAMRCAAVAPAHGGALDIIKPDENGILFTPGDCEALAQALVRAATLNRDGLRASVAEFSLPRMVRQTQAVYEQVLQKQAPRRG